MIKSNDLVGIIPAAGYANRVSSLLSSSKEIHPIKHPDAGAGSRPASSFLMGSFRKANVEQTYVILRSGKWDIPAYFTDGSDVGLNLAFIVTNPTEGVPQTIDKSYPFIKEKKVMLGFPDILFKPSDAFIPLLEKQEQTKADLVLGLFKSPKPEKADMILFDDKGNIKNIIIKPAHSDLIYTWIIAVWTPVFTEYLHNYLANFIPPKPSKTNAERKNKELYIGDVVRKAIQSGLKTTYIKFENGSFLDIGTPEELTKVNSFDWLRSFESID